MQNRVGQQFGNYRLLRLLGQGGFAEVYLGEHVYMQSKAAVKVLYGPLATNDIQSFLQEARTLDSLKHQNIVGIREFDIKHNTPFLVMDYAPNGTLRQRHTRGQRVPLETVVSYVLQVADALQYAHDRHIVHRDLKPENMLVGDNGNILLSDFGIAILFSSTHSYVSKGPSGTYLYMAPEQITGKALPASDQYALGIIVYEWLCGEVPFVGSIPEITAKHINVPPPPLREKGVAIAPQVENVVKRALAKDPQRRFASVREFALALQSSSKAQQGNRMHSPATNSKDSIILAPSSHNTPGFTDSLTQSPPVAMPPLHTPSTRPPVAPLPLAPTIYASPPPYVPTQPAHPKSGSKCLVTSLIGVVVLLFVIGSGAVFTILGGSLPWIGGRTSFAVNTPEELINGFCGDLGWPHYQSAYEKYSKRLQDQVSFTDFVNYWSVHNRQAHHIDRCDHQTIPTPPGSTITAPWSTHEFYSSQVQHYNVTFVIQGNEWKIDRITPNESLASVTNTPEELINDFCGDLGWPNYQSAYEKYSKRLRSQVSFTDFVNYWSANNSQYYSIDRCDHQTIPNPSERTITAPWSTHEFYSSQVRHYSVTFVIQDNEWKIDQISSV